MRFRRRAAFAAPPSPPWGTSCQPTPHGARGPATLSHLPDAGGYGWVQSDSDTPRLSVYRAPAQLDGYDISEHSSRPSAAKEWGTMSKHPPTPTCFGLAPQKIGPAPTYRLNGTPISA